MTIKLKFKASNKKNINLREFGILQSMLKK